MRGERAVSIAPAGRPVARRAGRVLGRPDLRDIAREAMTGLLRNRPRGLLSMLGIAWGIVSVILLLAYGDGFDAALARGFAGAFGDGVSVVFPGQTSLQAGGERAGRIVRLRLADAAVVGDVPLVRTWSPEYMRDTILTWGVKEANFLVRAVAPAYTAMRPQPVMAGRFIDAEDVRLQRRVVFLGSEVARRLFGQIHPVGETLRLGGRPFTVIGVQREKVQLSTYRRPDRESVFIPYTTAGQLWNTEYLSTLVFQAVDPTLDGRAQAAVREALAGRLGFNPADERALRFDGSASTRRITDGIVLGLKLVLTFVGVLTLTIGGVGVMNIMFVSVTERTREIGLRKALGARRGAILLQFLLEGLATTAAGGVAGVVIAALLAWATSPRPFLSELVDDATGSVDIHLRLSVTLLAVCAGILAAVGLVSSFLPALRASRMSPIEALRHE